MPAWLVALHRPPVRLHPGPGPPVPNAVVAEDDFLRTRLRACLCCGKREVTLDQQTVPRPPLHQWGLSPTLPCRYHIDLPWWMMPRRLGKGQPWQGGEYLL